MAHTSGFNMRPDNQKPDEGLGLLLIAAAVITATATGTLSLLASTGMVIPPFITVVIGLVIGVPLGIGIARSLTKPSD